MGIRLSLGDIIEEHKGFRALGKDIIHAHGNGINADSVVLVHCERYL